MSDIVIDTPEGINAFHVLQVIHALSIEIRTGMTVSGRGSVLKVAKQQFGFKGRLKRDALLYMVQVMREIDPTYELSPSIARALEIHYTE